MDVVIIGAGQAGLSAAYHLVRRGVARKSGFVVLDADAAPGGAWQHRWPTLTWERIHGLHPLPDSDAPIADPQTPAKDVVAPYFAEYERVHELPVIRPIQVLRVEEANDTPTQHSPTGPLEPRLLDVVTDRGTWRTQALLNATGTWTRPYVPRVPGQAEFSGQQLHTVDYPGPKPFTGEHVVVVGAGRSAVQHLAEISEVATTTWVTRHPPQWSDQEFNPELGRKAVAMVAERVEAGLPPHSVVSVTGLGLGPHEEDARTRGVYEHPLPMFDRVVTDGIVWHGPSADGRVPPAHVTAQSIVYATGFRHALEHLSPLKLRGPQGGIRMSGTEVAADKRIHLLGYGPSASTIGATRAGRAAVTAVLRWLSDPATSSS